VEGARFHCDRNTRGFRGSCEGARHEMAAITARICRICSAEPTFVRCSGKTGDRILSVTDSPTAVKLRRLLNPGPRSFSRMRCVLSSQQPRISCVGWTATPPSAKHLRPDRLLTRNWLAGWHSTTASSARSWIERRARVRKIHRRLGRLPGPGTQPF